MSVLPSSKAESWGGGNSHVALPNTETRGHVHDACAKKIRCERGLGVVPEKKKAKKKRIETRRGRNELGCEILM